jgi:conjugative transfer signal peptidase TraF
MGNSLNHKIWTYFAVFALCTAAAWFLPRHVAVTVTPSLRYKVFFLRDRTGMKIRKGDYVMFSLDHPVVKELKFGNAIKEVVCAGGDRLTVNGKDYYCNEARLGRAKDMSIRGERVDNFKYDGIVPAKFLFVMGHTIDSFDSRYLGFISVGDVDKIARPLF